VKNLSFLVNLGLFIGKFSKLFSSLKSLMNRQKMNIKILVIKIVIVALFAFSCTAQTGKDKHDDACVNREPVVSGQFYPDNPGQLKSQMESFFSSAKGRQTSGNLRALIAPHAGYVFSGQVAASAYNQISPEAEYDNIFIIAPSHRVRFDGASIYNIGNYKTPLGEVKVNRALADSLIKENAFFQFKKSAHEQEHSLEVQLPFLQYHLKKDFQIVPIVTGTHSPDVCEKIARALKPCFTSDNLFIVSTDFSHYPDYKDARDIDKETADAVVTNSPEKFLQTIHANKQKNIPNLATSSCGWPGILSLLHLTSQLDNCRIEETHYMNSGDVAERKDRVVGYWAISFFTNNHKSKKMDNMGFQLNKEEKNTLLNIARHALEHYLNKGEVPEVDQSELTENLKEQTGAFVTLTKMGNLRGCIGRFDSDLPLYEVVQKMAIAAATRDMRFPGVEQEELDDIELEISVLTPMQKVESIDEITLGEDGVYIKKGNSSGTFLPQVAEKTQWNKEEFLGHCARDKAGIGWDGWKEADVYKYQAIVFHE
jgi:AmmeMemoRadiSam system protein B/AmmeMemoRadiSam system protein A